MKLADHQAILRELQEGKEPPEEHVRNALTLLGTFHQEHPAVWEFSPDLQALEKRLWMAVWSLELSKGKTHD